MTSVRRRAELVEFARSSIVRGSKSFSLASRLFDRTTRERAWLLYSWCRTCDDLADGQDHGGAMGHVSDAPARVATMRRMVTAALAGDATGDPAFDGLGLVVAECGIPHRFVHDLIDGFALDAAQWRPADEQDLLRYCYHVAGAVGCMMAVLMGVDPGDEASLDRACDLGLAFQLANIARDVAEDAAAGRCYLPASWLAEKAIPPAQLMDLCHRPALTALVGRLCTLSERYEASARSGTAVLPWRARWAVLAAAGIYGDIARKVRLTGDSAWNGRVHTGKVAKAAWVARAAMQTWRIPRASARDGLWIRPR